MDQVGKLRFVGMDLDRAQRSQYSIRQLVHRTQWMILRYALLLQNITEHSVLTTINSTHAC